MKNNDTKATAKVCNICSKKIKDTEEEVFNSNAENFRANGSLSAHKSCLTGTGSKPIQQIENERERVIAKVEDTKGFVSSSQTKIIKKKTRKTK